MALVGWQEWARMRGNLPASTGRGSSPLPRRGPPSEKRLSGEDIAVVNDRKPSQISLRPRGECLAKGRRIIMRGRRAGQNCARSPRSRADGNARSQPQYSRRRARFPTEAAFFVGFAPCGRFCQLCHIPVSDHCSATIGLALAFPYTRSSSRRWGITGILCAGT